MIDNKDSKTLPRRSSLIEGFAETLDKTKADELIAAMEQLLAKDDYPV